MKINEEENNPEHGIMIGRLREFQPDTTAGVTVYKIIFIGLS